MKQFLVQNLTYLFVASIVFFAILLIEFIFTNSYKKINRSNIIVNFVAMLIFILVGNYLSQLSGHNFGLETTSSYIKNPIIYCILFTFLHDLIYYFYHRVQHGNGLLWKIHQFHHTDPDLNITSSHRTNFLESTLQRILIFIPAIAVLKVNIEGLIYSYFVIKFFLFFTHARLNIHLGPLNKLLASPLYHRIHHSKKQEHHNKNFAQQYSIIDYLFGTYFCPAKIRNIETGVDKCDSLQEQIRPMFWPLLKS